MSLSVDIKQNAEDTIKMFAGSHQKNLKYDEEGVKFLDEFINESGSKFNDAQKDQLIRFLGAFLGECVRLNYGGDWEVVNNEAAVKFDEKNAVFPFSKTRKHFENGSEDSILSFYQIIPIVFKLNK